MKKIVLIIVVLLYSIHSIAQEGVTPEEKKKYGYYMPLFEIDKKESSIYFDGKKEDIISAEIERPYGSQFLPIDVKEVPAWINISVDITGPRVGFKKIFKIINEDASPYGAYLVTTGNKRSGIFSHDGEGFAFSSIKYIVSFRYQMIPLHTLTFHRIYSSFLPSDIRIPLFAKDGFSSKLYAYEYQLINDPSHKWVKMEYGLGHSNLNVCAKDIFEDSKFPDIYGEQINLRVVSYDLGKAEKDELVSWSDPLRFTILPSGPEIINKTITPPKCDGETGSITLAFSRKLIGDPNEYETNKKKLDDKDCSYLGETLSFSIKNHTLNNAINYKNDTTKILLTTNTLTLSDIPFREGTNYYEVQLFGKYYYKSSSGSRKSISLYTDGEKQSFRFSVTMPSALTATATSANITCHGANNGSITFNIAGGTPPYSYSIAKNSAPFSPYTPFSDSSNKITNLAAGNYNVHIQDANGCSVKDGMGNPINFRFTITEPPALSIKAGTESITHITTPNANDGAYNATLEGGNGNTYTGTLTKIGSTYQSQQIGNVFNFQGLSAGDYRFVAADSKGCTTQTTFTIKDYVPMQVTITVTQPISCHSANPDPNDKDENLNGIGDKNENGTLSASVTGGLGNYKYQWFQQKNGTPIKMENKQEPILKNCSEGIYSLQVKDFSNNVVTQTVQLKFPEKLNIRVEAPLMQCSQPNSGTAKVFVTGGNPPYHYRWSNGDTTNSISNLTAGKYLITVTDHNGCSTQTQVILKFPDAIEVQPIVQHNRCYGVADGSISLKISGGKGAITIQWFDSTGKPITEHLSADKKQLTDLTAGTYKVVLSDESDCPTVTELIEVKPAAEIPFSFPDEITLCQGDYYLYTVSDTDFTQCSWVDSTGKEVATDNTFSATLAGVYTLKAIYKGSCQITKQFTVKQKNETFEMDFLAATTSYYDYTLKLIDISKRIDSEQWLLPEGVEMISQQNREAEIRFPKEGVYTIGLQGTLGGCTKRVYKKFWTEKDRIGIGNSDDFHKRISVLVVPNPAGRGTAPYIKVEMTEKSPINVRIFNILGQELFNKDFPAEEHFKILTNSLTLSAGDYIVIVQADKDIIAAKMVIN
ncbi:Por secretion system C-terminal sorting domain [Capnocytophaga haemolytica]|uniref:Por secretion system C-terminal sorting domain n=4 Tax=Capnocytophaga haemolytica TaxID=45243 RepID=A0AAX2H2X8_9FLAO|nr:Por secretion system C-terminal sorting domain [Capnocytophaga haemolytica]